MENVIENNRLIALFMGYSKGVPEQRGCKEERFALNGRTYLLSQLDYHASWDWLMPVVEKIEVLLLRFEIAEYECYLSWQGVEPDDKNHMAWLEKFSPISSEGYSKMVAVYLCIIQFIKWFNLQTP